MTTLTHWIVGDLIIFRCVLKSYSTDSCWGMTCEITPRWMSLNIIYNKSAFVQVMVWCHQGISHYPKELWQQFMSPYGVTRPQWVNTLRKTFWSAFSGKQRILFCSVCTANRSKYTIDNTSILISVVILCLTDKKSLHKTLMTQLSVCIIKCLRGNSLSSMDKIVENLLITLLNILLDFGIKTLGCKN